MVKRFRDAVTSGVELYIKPLHQLRNNISLYFLKHLPHSSSPWVFFSAKTGTYLSNYMLKVTLLISCKLKFLNIEIYLSFKKYLPTT